MFYVVHLYHLYHHPWCSLVFMSPPDMQYLSFYVQLTLICMWSPGPSTPISTTSQVTKANSWISLRAHRWVNGSWKWASQGRRGSSAVKSTCCSYRRSFNTLMVSQMCLNPVPEIWHPLLCRPGLPLPPLSWELKALTPSSTYMSTRHTHSAHTYMTGNTHMHKNNNFLKMGFIYTIQYYSDCSLHFERTTLIKSLLWGGLWWPPRPQLVLCELDHRLESTGYRAGLILCG